MKKQIGQLEVRANGKKTSHPIEHWKGYGIVVPTRFTTNGCVDLAASCIFNALDTDGAIKADVSDYSARLVLNGVEVSPGSVPELQEMLTTTVYSHA